MLWSDDENFLYAMEAVSPAVSWKERLLAGDLNPACARTAGQALGMTIAGSWQDPDFEARYGDQRPFDQLRTDPYYRTIARRHPAIAQQVYDWIAQIEPLRLALTHGDWSPKNMLVRGDGLVFIDYECIHFGDPSYDIAFCLNHLCLKGFHMPQHATALHDLARTFLAATLAAAPYEDWKRARLAT
ncbi:MAG: phosphotransferase [Bryobacterales bacterium]